MILRRHHFKFDSLFLNKLQFVVLSSHSRYLAQRECTVGVLYDFVAYECSRPVWFALSTDVDITVEDSSTRAERTPSPDITVGTVAGSLARIENSAVGTTLIAPCLWLLHLHGSVFAEDAPRIASHVVYTVGECYLVVDVYYDN